ncbi:MAG: FmdB family zinc ribbon protein [Spirochaeta sp.]
MPSYDYECEACGFEFEEFQAMSDPVLTDCPSCKEPALRRLIGGGLGVIFKGSGFYVNDSRGAKKSAAVGGGSSSSDSPGSSSDSSGGSSKSGDGSAVSSGSTAAPSVGGSSSGKTKVGV